MLSIRLSRVGKRNAPIYRVVVMPKHNDPWAIATEILGHYHPRKNPSELVLNADRVKHWLSKGAQPTDTVWNLLVDEKLVEGEKRGVTHLSKKRRGKLEEEAVEQKTKNEEAATKTEEAAEAAKDAAQAQAAAPAPVVGEAHVDAPAPQEIPAPKETPVQ